MAIETAVLHKPVFKHMYYVKCFFACFLICCAILYFTSFNNGLDWKFTSVLNASFWLSLIATVFFAMLFPVFAPQVLSKIQTKTRKALEDYIGQKPDYLNSSISRHEDNDITFSGTAIASLNDIIYIVDHGVVAKINWDDIRKWGWRTAAYEKFSGVGLSGTLNANIANSNTKADAYVDSGFFIEVKDVDKPSWQFMCDDQNVLKRWNEILTQMDERLPTA